MQVEDNNLSNANPDSKMVEEDMEQDQFKTPHKVQQDSGYNQNLLQTSPSFLNQVLGWKDSLEKYKDDPDIANVINQMNVTIQFHPQASEQQFQESPKRILEDQSYSLGNQSFKFDIFQKLNENIQQIQEEIHNQSFQSPRTIDLSRICNETCSEIKQQVLEIERSYKSIKYNIVDKDEELNYLSHQLEKDFNFTKQNRQIKSMEIPQNILHGEIFQRYQIVKQTRKQRANSFKIKQREEINELRQCLTQLKTECKDEWPKQISSFRDDVLSEASKFYSIQNENNQIQEQLTQLKNQFNEDLRNLENQEKVNDYSNSNIFQAYYQVRESYQQQIEELRELLNESENKFKQYLKGQNQQLRIDENLWQNILKICNLKGFWEDHEFFAKTLQTLYNIIIESQNDIKKIEEKYLTIQANQNLRNNQLQIEFDQKIFALNNQIQKSIIHLRAAQMQNQELSQQIKQQEHEKNQLIQELEEFKLRDYITLSTQLVTLSQSSMKQQQQLIYIGLKIFQQFLIVTSIDKNVLMNFKEQTDYLAECSNKLNLVTQMDQIQIPEALELIEQNSIKVDQVIENILKEYRSIIQSIKLSHEEWIKQFQ